MLSTAQFWRSHGDGGGFSLLQGDCQDHILGERGDYEGAKVSQILVNDGVAETLGIWRDLYR
jgi:hypothetical protein